MKFQDSAQKKYNSVVNTVRKHPWRTLLIILLVCFSFVLKVNEMRTGIQHEFPGSDPYASNQNAVEVLHGEKPINTYLNPFVTVYLITVYSIFGEHMWVAKFIQILASFIIPFFIYYFTKKYFGETAGFIGAVLALVHPSIIFYSAHLWSEFWIIFIFSALLYLFARCMSETEGNAKRALTMGIITGVASLGKIWMGLIGGVLVLFVLIREYDRKAIQKSLKRIAKTGALAFAGVALILVPWIIYASVSAGFFVFVNMNSQTNLYIGNNPEGEIAFTSKNPYNWDYMNVENIGDVHCGDVLENVSGTTTSAQYDEYLRKCAGKYAVNYILDNPGIFMHKMTVFTFKYWIFPNLEFYQRYIKTPKLLQWTLWIFWVLAFIGIVVSFSKYAEFLPFYVIMLIVWFFSGMAFYLARYKAGLSPLTIFFAAGGCYTLLYMMKGKKKSDSAD